MALSSSTFSNLGGAVSDIFGGLGAKAKGEAAARGLEITASGTRLGAQGTRLTAEGLRIKARGDIAEADNYDLASGLALENLAYTQASTRIQLAQTDRRITQTIGGQRASVAAAGFGAGGTAGDLLRDSASQGALAKAVLANQGVITEAGYKEQAKSYETMSAAARATAASEFGIADKTDLIAAGQDQIATQQDQLAVQTRRDADNAAAGSFISAAIKGVAAIASVVAAPATGGASLAALPFFAPDDI